MVVPYGYCNCGCGRKTWISDKTDNAAGRVKGEPVKFCRGHKSPGYRGELHASWKGGKVKHIRGYCCVQAPDHPKNNHGYVLEHVLVMEQAIGGFLPDGAIVHHKNGNKKDNRIENLQLFENIAEHLHAHAVENTFKVCGHSDWRKCWMCKKYDDPENMYISKNGKKSFHLSCQQARRKSRSVSNV